jgi:hypothetical protein
MERKRVWKEVIDSGFKLLLTALPADACIVSRSGGDCFEASARAVWQTELACLQH